MRISGITIPDKKRAEIGLQSLYGIGLSVACKILDEAGIDRNKKIEDITKDEESKIREAVEQMTIEGDLKRQTSSNIKRLKDIKAYRGMRHSKGLPARGQRTKTNSRTVRGNVRKTMGSGRTKVEKT